MDFLSRSSFASILVAAIVAALPEKSPGEDRVTRVFEVPNNFLPGSAREEVVEKLTSLGSVIGEPDSVIYDSLNQRLVARSTKEKLAQIEAALAQGSQPAIGTMLEEPTLEETVAAIQAEVFGRREAKLRADGDFEGATQQYSEGIRLLKTDRARQAYRRHWERRREADSSERLCDPDAVDTSDVIDRVPFLGIPPQRGDGLDIILPEVDFSDMPLAEVLARIKALCNERNPDPPKGMFEILLDAPGMIAKKPVTLHLVDVPASKAIRAAAEAASCQLFAFSGFAFVSCIDLFPQKPTGKRSPRQSPESLWLDAFWHLYDGRFYNAKPPAIATDQEEEKYQQGKYRAYLTQALGTYASLAEAYPDFHPELVWAKMSDIAERLAYE